MNSSIIYYPKKSLRAFRKNMFGETCSGKFGKQIEHSRSHTFRKCVLLNVQYVEICKIVFVKNGLSCFLYFKVFLKDLGPGVHIWTKFGKFQKCPTKYWNTPQALISYFEQIINHKKQKYNTEYTTI